MAEKPLWKQLSGTKSKSSRHASFLGISFCLTFLADVCVSFTQVLDSLPWHCTGSLTWQRISEDWCHV